MGQIESSEEQHHFPDGQEPREARRRVRFAEAQASSSSRSPATQNSYVVSQFSGQMASKSNSDPQNINDGKALGVVSALEGCADFDVENSEQVVHISNSKP